mmetsp:Transcript_61330/g.161165  ORF Transcript_61330/g.161165 Transcript_61330/m.161165 type:complete len:201 (-) Transcript_61330:477-1079(-)
MAFFWHSSRSLSPSDCWTSKTGMEGKPQLHVLIATLRSPHSVPPPMRLRGSLFSWLITMIACAPACAPLWAFRAKGANSPLGLPRRTRRTFPWTSPPQLSIPKALSSLKWTVPDTRSPVRSAFQSARCASMVTGSTPAPVIRMGCRSSGLGPSACSTSPSLIRSRRSSSSSIMAMSGKTPSMTALTSRGARGDMCKVATR